MEFSFPKICADYQALKCNEESCDRLHLCKQFILFGKEHPSECNLNHCISQKDEAVLRFNGLDSKYHQVFEFLRDIFHDNPNRRPTATLPPTCDKYNSSQCSDKACTNMHLCRKLGYRGCNLKPQECTRSHDLNPEERAKLQRFGFNGQSQNALTLYLHLLKRFNEPCLGNENPVSSATFAETRDTGSTGEVPVICAEFLASTCRKGVSCSFVHSKTMTPFLWSWRSAGCSDWIDFEKESNEHLEIKFCMPEIDEGLYEDKDQKFLFNFENMKVTWVQSPGVYRSGDLRRIDTGNNPWKFFYQDRKGKHWRFFMKKDNSGIDSAVVEEIFQNLNEGETKEVEFEIRNMSFRSPATLYLRKCEGKNNFDQSYGKKERKKLLVKRRPNWKRSFDLNSETFQPLQKEQTELKDHEKTDRLKTKHSKIDSDSCAFWKIRDESSTIWEFLPDDVNKSLEDRFCHVQLTSTEFHWKGKRFKVEFYDSGSEFKCSEYTDFDEETKKSSENKQNILVTRVCPNTKWSWFWSENPKNAYPKIQSGPACLPDTNWVPYGTIGIRNVATELRSDEIEKFYNNKTTPAVTFSAGNVFYELDFKNFVQRRKDRKGKVRRVRRRPREAERRVLVSGKFFPLPPFHWIATEWCEDIQTRMDVLVSHLDESENPLFNDKEDERWGQFFMQSLKLSSHDFALWRIENRRLWENHQNYLKGMSERLGGEHSLNEVELLTSIDEIDEEKFGIFIRSNSSEAEAIWEIHQKPNRTGIRLFEASSEMLLEQLRKYSKIIVLKVAVGTYKQGLLGDNFFDADGNQFDSLVDDIKNPKTIVVSNPLQVYPLYEIDF